MRRQAKFRLNATARAVSLGLVLGLAGCAQLHGFFLGGPNPDQEAAWLGFLSGEDIHLQCEAAAPDAFRLVWRRTEGEFRVLEVLGNESGGALMIHRAFSLNDMARGAPPTALPERHQRLVLSPDNFTGMLYWFGRLGMFAPVPGTPGEPGAALEWLISSCLDGTWSLGVHIPVANGKDSGGRV